MGIESMDYITKVNGVSGKDMFEKLKTDSSLEITILKSKEITVTLMKSGKLSLDLFYNQEKEYIGIQNIQDGAVKTHNAQASAEQQIRVGAHIVAVNGTRGRATALLEKLNIDGSLELVLRQPPK